MGQCDSSMIRKNKRSGVDKDLMPGLPNDITMAQIISRLPFYQIPVLMTLNTTWRMVLLNQNNYYTDNTHFYQRHAIADSIVFYVVRLGVLESLSIYHQGALKTLPLPSNCMTAIAVSFLLINQKIFYISYCPKTHQKEQCVQVLDLCGGGRFEWQSLPMLPLLNCHLDEILLHRGTGALSDGSSIYICIRDNIDEMVCTECRYLSDLHDLQKDIRTYSKEWVVWQLNEAEQKWSSSVSMQFLNAQFVKPSHPPQYLLLHNTDNNSGELLQRHIVLRPYFSKHYLEVQNFWLISKQTFFSVKDDFEGEKVKSIHYLEKVGNEVLCYKIYFQNTQTIVQEDLKSVVRRRILGLSCSDVVRVNWSDEGRKLAFSLPLLRGESRRRHVFYDVNMAQEEAMYMWSFYDF
ncbi:hypothetical protein SUGI_0552570 [Cryptomeria japonica]|nr:hypothetical protein SUGI_0552570 [Cryptomeria japonica]